MKIIFAFIVALILTLSGSYNLIFSAADTNSRLGSGFECIDCHGIRDLHNMTPDASLIVHQPNNPQFINGLVLFLSEHNEEEAAIKLVDYQRVIDIVSSQ